MWFRGVSLFLWVGVAMAQTVNVSGDYAGVLGPLHLKLHLKAGAASALTGTLDSVDQGANGLACANFRLEGKTLAFDVPSVGGKWRGTVSDDGATLSGTWSQGADLPLTFQREGSFIAAAQPSRVDGVWLGTLTARGAELRIQVQVKSDRTGKEYCTVDSLDQAAMGLVCENVQFHGSQFSFDVPLVHGRWSGTLSENGDELAGNWSQGSELPLRLKRQASVIEPKKPEPPKFDAALPPVPASELKAVLDRDMAAALKDGALGAGTDAGLVIGVVQQGKRQIFVYGTAKEDSIFEIGSISKTFTGLMLAQMAQQGKVRLDEPLRELLPRGTVAKPAGPEITLLDLATQHSGMPRLPDNLNPADARNPYADYDPAKLYSYLAGHGVAKPEDATFTYSNLGLGLLGQALAVRARVPYGELLQTQIAKPLGLKDTVVTLTAEQVKRFLTGHDAQHRAARGWDFDALAGAGAIRSTASDMLTYLEAQLHPDKAGRGGAAGSPEATLPAALRLSQELRADAMPTMRIALAWLYNPESGMYWHNGGTGGYSSFAFFVPKADSAAVVLFNTTLGQNGSFADRVGQHVAQRLQGKAAISLRE